jgi:hypothetical protein
MGPESWWLYHYAAGGGPDELQNIIPRLSAGGSLASRKRAILHTLRAELQGEDRISFSALDIA